MPRLVMKTIEHHRAGYRNHLDEPIELKIISASPTSSENSVGTSLDQVADKDEANEICLISIERDRLTVMRKYWLRWLVVILVFGSLVFYFASNWIRSHVVWSILMALSFVSLLFYVAQPVVIETLVLLSGLKGVQVTKGYLFGASRSTFINARRLLINEAITMQQVIFYLVAVPPRLEPYIFEEPNQQTSTFERPLLKTQSSVYDVSLLEVSATSYQDEQIVPPDVPLVPLFLSTIPRLDCLQVIYRHLSAFNIIHSQAANPVASSPKKMNNHIHKRTNGFIKSSHAIVTDLCNFIDTKTSRKENPVEENFVHSTISPSTSSSLSSASKSSSIFPLLRYTNGHCGGGSIR